MSNLETLSKTLKKNGYSVTAPRKAVFEQLLRNQPLSVAKLAKICSPKINRASVYRTVALYEQLDVINRVWLGYKSYLELSDVFSPHHHHLTCLKCGAVIAVEDVYLENSLAQIATRFRFKPEQHNVEISGVCQLCNS